MKFTLNSITDRVKALFKMLKGLKITKAIAKAVSWVKANGISAAKAIFKYLSEHGISGFAGFISAALGITAAIKLVKKGVKKWKERKSSKKEKDSKKSITKASAEEKTKKSKKAKKSSKKIKEKFKKKVEKEVKESDDYDVTFAKLRDKFSDVSKKSSKDKKIIANYIQPEADDPAIIDLLEEMKSEGIPKRIGFWLIYRDRLSQLGFTPNEMRQYATNNTPGKAISVNTFNKIEDLIHAEELVHDDPEAGSYRNLDLCEKIATWIEREKFVSQMSAPQYVPRRMAAFPN